MEQIRLNLIPEGQMPVCHVSQYDTGRVIRVYLYDGNKPYFLSDETVEINVRKGDRKIYTADLEVINGRRSVDIITAEQMTAIAGKNEAELKITKGEYSETVIATLNFIIEVERSPMQNGLESQSEINNLARQIHDDVVIELRDRGAEDTGYNNAASGLQATNVQDAIDETNEKIDSKADAAEMEQALATKADASSVYNKQAVDDKLGEKADTSYVNTELGKKADKATTYTKTEVDTALSAKANTSDVNTALALKADKSDTYNKQSVDDKLALKESISDLERDYYNKTQVDNIINNLPEPMVFKGTLGVNGTITSLPTASAENEGYTYKVITDGTYAGQTAKVGDVFTSNGSEWVLIPAGDEDNDTWRAIKVNGVEKLDNGISSGSVDIVEGDNINITFDGNGNKVEIEADTIDDTQALTTKSWSGKKTFDEIVNILPTGNASGSIANFNTSLALPMEIEAEFGADVGGVNAVSVSECGKNLFPDANVSGTTNMRKDLNLKAGTYTFSALATSSDIDNTVCGVLFQYTDDSYDYMRAINRNVRQSFILTLTKDTKSIYFYASEVISNHKEIHSRLVTSKSRLETWYQPMLLITQIVKRSLFLLTVHTSMAVK